MSKEKDSWDKFRAAIQKKAALSACARGHKPLSKGVIDMVKSQTQKKDVDYKEPGWFKTRPEVSAEDLVGYQPE